jgi:hypothetical protein
MPKLYDKINTYEGSFTMKTRKRRHNVFEIALFLSALAFASCSRTNEIKPPPTPLLTGGLGWAVIKDSYVRLKESPSDSARDVDHLHRGAVFGLEARELGSRKSDSAEDDKPNIWYELESSGVKGWVSDSELDIYAYRTQAENATKSYQ